MAPPALESGFASPSVTVAPPALTEPPVLTAPPLLVAPPPPVLALERPPEEVPCPPDPFGEPPVAVAPAPSGPPSPLKFAVLSVVHALDPKIASNAPATKNRPTAALVFITARVGPSQSPDFATVSVRGRRPFIGSVVERSPRSFACEWSSRAIASSASSSECGGGEEADGFVRGVRGTVAHQPIEPRSDRFGSAMCNG